MKSALVLVGSLAAAVGCAAILHNEPADDVESRPAHHMPDGTFVNTDGQAISKSFTDLLRWRWNRTEPSPQHFDVIHPDPDVIANPCLLYTSDAADDP